jgi:TonB family protein
MATISRILLLAALAGGISTLAQSMADFSGTWRLDPSRTSTTGGPLRITGRGAANLTPPVKIQNAEPRYPREALRDRVSGVVILDATIDRTGTVADARIVRSIPELDQAALDAVSRWKYRPATLNGVAVPTIMTVTVTFRLDGEAPARAVAANPGAPGSGRASGGGGGAMMQPQEAVITQSASLLTLTRDTGVGPHSLSYRLDGTPVKNVQVGRSGGGPPGEYTYISRWDGQKLVTEMTGATPTLARKETRWLDGDVMLVDIAFAALPGAEPLVRHEVWRRER